MRRGPEEGLLCCLADRPSRRLGLAGALLAGRADRRGSAAGQTDEHDHHHSGAGCPGGLAGPDRPSRRSCPAARRASRPALPTPVARAIKAANKIHRRTYIWGGGHRSFKAKGYDCSGAVSYVLHAAGRAQLAAGLRAARLLGLAGPRVAGSRSTRTGRTPTWSSRACATTPPRAGSAVDQGRGPRWRYTLRTRTGFAIRHWTPSRRPSGASCEYLLTAPDRLASVPPRSKRRISSPPVRDESGGTKAVGANPPRVETRAPLASARQLTP